MRWKLGLLILFCVLLTACGNKGPLVLPEKGDDNKVEEAKRELTS